MAEGYFVSHVYTSNGVIPISGAVVVVTQRRTGGTRLLGVRMSGRSGLTERITIETPEIDESLSPNQGRPYALVDIMAEYPGYGTVTATNVQIFPSVTTDQNFMLIPNGLFPGQPDESQEYNTPAQDL